LKRGNPGYCEVCGVFSQELWEVSVEGSTMLLCSRCLSKLGPRATIVEASRAVGATTAKAKPVKPSRAERRPLESFDIVEDYGERVRRAREARGWSEAVLAQKLRVSVDVVRRIESGKFKPPIDLARKLESLLKVKLLVPLEVEEFESGKPEALTFGDIVVVRRGEE